MSINDVNKIGFPLTYSITDSIGLNAIKKETNTKNDAMVSVSQIACLMFNFIVWLRL